MERAMSVEDKIRRAEEIYARRQGNNISFKNSRKETQRKDIKLLKKILIQLVISICIFGIVYVIQNSNYIFSEDFITKTNEILSYDINFSEIFGNLKNSLENAWNNLSNKQEENIGGAVEITEGGDTNIQNDNQQEINKTQGEQDIETAKNTTIFIKPIDEYEISSPYGARESLNANVPKNHTGIDLAANQGTKIKAASSGEVVLNSQEGDYGKHLKIQVGEVSIIYAHCNSLYVNQGEHVEQGQEIAEVGTTGNSTGPHLHFEIRVSERTINPQDILEF